MTAGTNFEPATATSSRRLKGLALVVGSAIAFALATVVVKVLSRFDTPAPTIAAGRFWIGAVGLSIWFLLRTGRLPWPRRPELVLGRAATNLVAVLLFYAAIARATITNANILNLTYPIFIALLAPLLLRERTSRRQLVAVAVGVAGVWTLIAPDFGGAGSVGDLIALACGFVSAFAVILLRAARQHDDADTIVWFVMVAGAAVLTPQLRWLGIAAPHQVGLWVLAGILGVAGQLLITTGYRHVSALDGSIASTSRMLFAVLFGAWLLDEPLGVHIFFGAGAVALSIWLIQGERP
ncbi:MAG: DMT family transporter [Candidatus Dadabacteria bacterium]|nr:MAG: DMT family transporter [Candidatus Dadabacteria bacterium]